MDIIVITDQGKRKEQQDSSMLIERNGDVLMGIFDGHGGSEASHFASQQFPAIFYQHLESSNSIESALRQTFLDLDQHFHDQNFQDGTTATVAFTRDNQLHLAHVGDSSAARVRNNELTMITKDHKITDPEEMAVYRSSNWFKEKSRLVSQGKVKGFKLTTISRSLGDVFFEDAISAEPDISEQLLQKGDTLILASDGLWHFIKHGQLLEAIMNQSSSKFIAEKLIQISLNQGGTDNVTVGIIRI